jgi:uncharacterized repeat protein (TIGR03803 family)
MQKEQVQSGSRLEVFVRWMRREWRGQGRALGSRIRSAKTFITLLVLCGATAMASASVTYKDLVNFDNTNGQNPIQMTLVQGIDGDLYGTTQFGGTYNNGTVFKISPSGTLTTLWSFCEKKNSNGFCADGDQPMTGLTLVIGGDLYGTTFGGGEHNAGTVFKITPAGNLTTIYSFCSLSGCADGLNPNMGTALIQGTDGNLYGSTGKNFFRLTTAGKLTNLYTYPSFAVQYPTGVVQASDGNFYLTVSGGVTQSGFILKITPAGKATTLYSFCSLTNCLDGANPGGPLVQGANDNLYGTTANGGKYGDGTFFELTLAGKLTTLHSFDYVTAGNLGADENSGVILGFDGNFYGVAELGGKDCTEGCGTLFRMTPAGVLTTLYEFTGGNFSWGPWGLMQDTDGTFYGTTANGGPKSVGTVYSVSDGLASFAELVTNYGPVGKTIDILGQGFTGATGVTFDGVKATFDNVSDTYMTVAVPSGALTGTVTVTTFTNTYKSKTIFKVTPQFTSFSPASGAVGSTVTLTGVSLTQTSSVMIGGLAATFKVVSDKEVTAVVPAGAKNAQSIAITTAGGSASKGPFAVEPKITSFTPTSGPVGTEVTISGTTFTGASKVTFDGVDATSLEVINDSEVKAIVPSGAKTGAIGITTPGGTATSSTNFTVN